MKEKLYNQKGEEIGKIDLPSEIFNIEINSDLIHQAMVAQSANSREAIAHTKDRSEKKGGGRKPWRQKGTGRARHGSIRSPIWKGGGVTFGPTKERNFSKSINKKMKKKALFMSLSSKLENKNMIFIDKIELTEGKTKLMIEILDNLKNKVNKNMDKSVLIVLPKTDLKVNRAVNNIPKIKSIRADSLNIVDVLNHNCLLFLNDSIEIIKQVYSK